MQQSSATPKKNDVGRGLREIVACSKSSSQCLLVSTVFGTVSSLHHISIFYTCFTHFSLTVSISTNRGLPSLALRMVFLPSTDGNTWISTPISLARTLYIRSCARSISENTHAQNRTRDS